MLIGMARLNQRAELIHNITPVVQEVEMGHEYKMEQAMLNRRRETLKVRWETKRKQILVTILLPKPPATLKAGGNEWVEGSK